MRGDLSLMVIAYVVGIIALAGIVYYVMGVKPQAAANATANATPAPEQFPSVSPTNVFAIPTTTPTTAPTPEPKEFCGDGTEEGKCSANLTLCTRVDGALSLVEDCEECGCGLPGQKCDEQTSKCFFGCDDGTPLRQCSNATPSYYCNANASLEINGFECGCPLGYQYDPYGSGPNTLNGCMSTCRVGEDCQPGK